MQGPLPDSVFTLPDDMQEQLAKAIEAPRDSLLTEHDATHGDYAKVAEFAQHLKAIFRSHPGWRNLTAVQRESIEMSSTKFARIMCGNPDTKDHWEDVAGYSKLVVEGL